jgi:uncharacterized protein YggU (UPF0235/DUF167 family)
VTDDPWRTKPDEIVIACRLTPKGGRDAIEGVATLSDGSRILLARVRSAPKDGKANAALCALIAETMNVSTSNVRLIAGAKSRLKQISVTGEPEALVGRFNQFEGI